MTSPAVTSAASPGPAPWCRRLRSPPSLAPAPRGGRSYPKSRWCEIRGLWFTRVSPPNDSRHTSGRDDEDYSSCTSVIVTLARGSPVILSLWCNWPAELWRFTVYIVLSHRGAMMIASPAESRPDVFNFSWVVCSQVKLTSTTWKDLCLYWLYTFSYLSTCLHALCIVGTRAHQQRLGCAAECVATVCLAGISVPFPDYFVSQFAS